MKKSLQNKVLGGLLAVLLGGAVYAGNAEYRSNYDIVILYTNDVHCFVDNSIGYAGLVAYKKDMQAHTPYVSLVDCGDHLQGNITGMASKGSYIVDIMNKAKYEYAIIGNHEFDYGLDVLRDRIKASKFQYLNCNATYNGKNEDPFANTVPFKVRRYGLNKVGFVGVVTPKSISSSTPANFKEDGRYVVDLKDKDNGQELFDTVQSAVNGCISAGANYVIVLSHLGTNASHAPFNSKSLIANTTGIDAVLDAHSHSIIANEIVSNKEGQDVLLTSTGTALERIGKLTINAGGIKSELISDYKNKDQAMTEFINSIKNNIGGSMNKIVGNSNQVLSVYNENGVRIVRNRETNIGNWVADAMAFTAGTEIGFCNGGGIRADIKTGEITLSDLYAVHTFNNTLIKAKVTGQKLLNILENSYRFVAKDAVGPDGSALNENGGFMQVSGINLTIDTSVESPIKVDDKGIFRGIEGPNRIQGISVKVNGKFEPLDPNKEYIIAAPDYISTGSKNGSNKISEDDVIEKYGVLPEAFVEYFKHLGGDFSKYKTIEGRIIIK